MIAAAVQTDHHLVEIQLKLREHCSSYQIHFSKNGEDWKPASLYPDLDPETVLNGNTFLWNQAQTLGTVRVDGTSGTRCYWNPYLQLGSYVGSVRLKASFLTSDGGYEDQCDVELRVTDVVFIDDWKQFVLSGPDGVPIPEEERWDVARAMPTSAVFLKRTSGPTPRPLQIPLPVKGLYDIYFGIAKGGLRCLLRIGEEAFSRFEGNGSRYIAGPEGKYNVEMYWKRRQIDYDMLEIAATKRTLEGHHQFGFLAYIKLVPCRDERSASFPSPEAHYERKEMKDLILYYEPYSYSIDGIHDTDTMNERMLEEFLRLNPREIACQTVRIGSKALHRSEFLESFDQAAKADDNSVNDDFVKLARSGDVLRETIRHASGRNVRITSCIGMNRPYLWNPTISEKFTRDHPELIRGGDFDYTRPEVREYALRIIEELIVNYELDGLIFDYMRHYLNQTPDTLVEIIGRTRAMLNRQQQRDGKKRELKVRFPADQWSYYKGLSQCVSERYVDGLIPSNLTTTFPLPPVGPYIQLCAGTNVNVYGCIDGWKWTLASDPRIGGMTMHHSPKDVTDAIDAYRAAGVDGIFVYQGDQFTANPYLAHLFLNRT